MAVPVAAEKNRSAVSRPCSSRTAAACSRTTSRSSPEPDASRSRSIKVSEVARALLNSKAALQTLASGSSPAFCAWATRRFHSITRGSFRRFASERLEVPRAFTNRLVPNAAWTALGTSNTAE